jgi:dTDP-4-dehydrorhamnose reductase
MYNSTPTARSILLTGSTGMLGTALLNQWQGKAVLYATASKQPSEPLYGSNYFLSFSLEEADFSPLAGFCSPEVIINCAAATDHIWCENNPNRARAVNALAPAKIAAIFPRAYFIHISTDAVFGPEAERPDENSPTTPQSVYGATKREGEKLLLERSTSNLVVRTTLVGLGGWRYRPSFAEWVLSSVKYGQETSLYDDVYFTPVSIWDFANLLEWLISMRPRGILHACGPQTISKYDFGFRLASACRLSTSCIIRTQLASQGTKQRLDQSLDSSLLKSMFGQSLPDADQCIINIAKHHSWLYHALENS